MNNAAALTDLIAFTLTTAGKTCIKTSSAKGPVDLGKILKAGEFGLWIRDRKAGPVVSLFVQPEQKPGKLRALKRIGESDSTFDPSSSKTLIENLGKILAA